MKHYYKGGSLISDNHMKRVKKILKKNPIKVDGTYWYNGDFEMEITNIRKYQNRLSDNMFVYEVDVKVKFNKPMYRFHNSIRSKNDRIRRYGNEIILREELEFFSIWDITISKIQYV
jgi:hypothetical protein